MSQRTREVPHSIGAAVDTTFMPMSCRSCRPLHVRTARSRHREFSTVTASCCSAVSGQGRDRWSTQSV